MTDELGNPLYPNYIELTLVATFPSSPLLDNILLNAAYEKTVAWIMKKIPCVTQLRELEFEPQ